MSYESNNYNEYTDTLYQVQQHMESQTEHNHQRTNLS